MNSPTISEAPSVTFRAATLCGFETACQKPSVPAFVDCQSSAASGSRTIRLR
jgi:hypothetical protein